MLGTRYAKQPIELQVPITIAGMSFGALSANVKEALGRAATAIGTSTTTGDGGMTAEERQSSKTLIYQCLPSRYGFKPDDVRRADAIEIVIGRTGGIEHGQQQSGQQQQEKSHEESLRSGSVIEAVERREDATTPQKTGQVGAHDALCEFG